MKFLLKIIKNQPLLYSLHYAEVISTAYWLGNTAPKKQAFGHTESDLTGLRIEHQTPHTVSGIFNLYANRPQGRRESTRAPGQGTIAGPLSRVVEIWAHFFMCLQKKGHHVRRCPIFKSNGEQKKSSFCDGALSGQTACQLFCFRALKT